MKSICDTKEFLALELEEKLKILELEICKYDNETDTMQLNKLQEEQAEVLAKISKNKERLSELKSVINQDGEVSQRIFEVDAELDELKKQAGVYKQKQVELNKHKNALELKSLTLQKSKLGNEIEELKNEIERLREQKIESQNSLVEVRANFETFYNSYNEEMARLMLEEKSFYSSSVNQNYSDEDVLEKFKLKENLKNLEDQSIKLKDEIEKLTLKCQAVEKDIEEKSETIESLEIPEESKELIVQAKDLEAEIIIYDGMLKRLGVLLDDIKDDLSQAKIEYAQELEKERKIQEDIKKIESSTSKVFESSELSNFEKLRSCDKSLAEMCAIEYEIGLIDKQIEKIKFRVASRLEKAEELKEQIEAAEQTLSDKQEVIKGYKQELTTREEDKESMYGSNCLSMIIDYTKQGNSCPVCKSTVREKNYVEKFDLTAIEKEIEMAKNRISYAEKDRDISLATVVGLKSRLDFELSQVEFENNEITNLENSKIKVYQKIIDVNDKTEENFTNLKTALKKTSSALENLINVQNDLKQEIQDNISKKTEQGSRISMLSEKYEQLLDVYYELQKERAERELLMFEAKTTVAGADFEQKRTEFAENDNILKVTSNELINTYMQLSELKTSIMVAQEKLVDVEFKKGKLESKLQHYGDLTGEENEQSLINSPEEIREKMENLKQTFKHLFSLKTDAENTAQNNVKEYEIKTKLLSYKIDELEEISALVSALVFRYGFADEDQAREYSITDNMLKIKENEIKSYDSRVLKLEVERAFLGGNNTSEENNEQEIVNLTKENEDLTLRLGELNSEIVSLQESINEYNKIVELMKRYK